MAIRTSDRWARLFEIGSEQHGAIQVQQALALGIGRSTLTARAQREGWGRPHAGVLLLPGVRPRFATRVSAALLAAGERSLASRATAAYLHGMVDRPPDRVEVVVPSDRARPRLEGVRAWRSGTLLVSHATTAEGLATTTAERTIHDLGAISTLPQLRAIAIDACQRRITTVSRALEVCAAIPRTQGRGRVLRVLHDLDEDACDSIFEHHVRQGVRRTGLRPDPGSCAVRAGTRTIHVDVPFACYRTGIECDGMGYHSDRRQLDLDRRRQNEVVVYTDWTLLHITWDRYDRDFGGFLEELRVALKWSAARLGLPDPTIGMRLR